MWILFALDASPQKQLYTFFVTAQGRKRFGTNHWESCPYPSFDCHYKTGLDTMLRRIGLPCHTTPHGKSFPFTCWKLWLARNEIIFKNQSCSQHSLIYSSVQATTKFHFLAGTTRRPPILVPQIIRWQAPPTPILNLTLMAVPKGTQD